MLKILHGGLCQNGGGGCCSVSGSWSGVGSGLVESTGASKKTQEEKKGPPLHIDQKKENAGVGTGAAGGDG